MKGKYIVFILISLTGIVGGLFIVIGPETTEKNPGVLHVGIRYSDEMSMAFTRYPKGGPGATIRFIDDSRETVYEFGNLKTGRNLVPIGPELLPSGLYTAELSAEGYKSRRLPVVIEGRMLNPPLDADFEVGTHADYNMVGVRLEAAEKL